MNWSKESVDFKSPSPVKTNFGIPFQTALVVKKSAVLPSSETKVVSGSNFDSINGNPISTCLFRRETIFATGFILLYETSDGDVLILK